ncbi:MAG: PrsW family intramembrane metalloprotease [Dongiaceae bacterium]
MPVKLLLIFFALLPGGLLAGFFVTYFRHRLSGELAAIALGLGVISNFLVIAILTLPSQFIHAGLPPISVPAGAFNDAFLMAAIPEEAAKFLLLMTIIRRHEDCDSGGDLFCSAVLIGLGFAAIENILYLDGSGTGWLSVGALRSVLAVPGHAMFGIIMGYFAAVAQRETGRRRTRWQILALICPIIAHGLYDFPLMAFDMVANDNAGTLVRFQDQLTYLRRLPYLELGVLVVGSVIAWLVARQEMVAIYDERSDIDLAPPSSRALRPWRVLGWAMIAGACLCMAIAGWLLAREQGDGLYLFLCCIFPLTFGLIMQMRPRPRLAASPAG